MVETISNLPSPPQTLPTRAWNRALALLILAFTLGLLVPAARLQPDPSGMGTHTQLGLPPCPWPTTYGYPCPTCGVTTAAALAAHGRLIEALIVQPAGALLTVALAAAALLSAYALVTGISLKPLLGAALRPATLWIIVMIVLLAWGYKVMLGS
ncbi:MAG: DUF2752 domain-containing protein [Phycisphaeraceae bacterium]|nr:DUF2752 domain-containing protein [Phycisphaeraceae bacterium]